MNDIETLNGGFKELRALVYYLGSQINTLTSIALEQIMLAKQISEKEAQDIVHNLIRDNYAKWILEVGDKHPATAEEVDIRRRVKLDEPGKWFLPEDG